MARVACIVALLASAVAAASGREAVLKQVDLPHNYYWRELYLPQLTTGPSAVSFLPDGESLVYSMGGSLWRQRIGEEEAVELTHAKGAYDYQPDVARDGRSVVFTRYDGGGLELWRLDLDNGTSQALTQGGAVNVEPRLSPDGHRIAWVSTQGTGHFNLFVAQIDAAGLHNARPLLGERRSTLDRYYYSAFDHAINPSWSPDGRSLLYVGNPEIAWGTGDLSIVQVDSPAKRHTLVSEETSWSARPEFAPDGNRILFSSYHGRQAHQLWLTTVQGAAPLPLTFGDSERRNARWSPDGKRIAYIGNAGADGNTQLIVMEPLGGASRVVEAKRLRTLSPTARLTLDIRDAGGKRVPRVFPCWAAMPAHTRRETPGCTPTMDSIARSSPSRRTISTAPRRARSMCRRARRRSSCSMALRMRCGRSASTSSRVGETTADVALVAHALPAAFGDWISADLHVHMNYGGHYRNTPEHLAWQAQAEDLDLVENLIVNKEERIPDIAWFGQPGIDTRPRIAHAQEFHTSFWGHLGLLNLRQNYIAPDFSAYRHTALASPWPHNGVIADLAHAQQGVVGYVHPFDTVPDPANDASLTHELPADVAHGKVDYMEVVGFSDHKATASVWYRLMNLGYRIPAGAGSDTMANYASLRGPVGMNRVFLDTAGRLDDASVFKALKAGHGFASNGPLLGLLVDGRKPGESIAAQRRVPYRVAMRAPVSVDHLELVSNGEVVKRFDLTGDRMQFDNEGTLELPQGGWLLLRAWNDDANPLLLDLYPYATTNPVWLEGPVPDAHADAAYFIAWLDRVIEAAGARDDYNDASEKDATLAYLREAQSLIRKRAGDR